MEKRSADDALGSPAKKAATIAEPFVISLADVEAAAKNIEGVANKTPVMTSGCMDGLAGECCGIKIKCTPVLSMLQNTGDSGVPRPPSNSVSVLAL